MENIVELIKEFSKCEEVESIALGGFRAMIRDQIIIYTYM